MDRLRDLREDKDLKQKDIAKLLNIPTRTYSSYENGERSLPIDILIKLSYIYDTSTDYILGITNVNKSYPKIKNNFILVK